LNKSLVITAKRCTKKQSRIIAAQSKTPVLSGRGNFAANGKSGFPAVPQKKEISAPLPAPVTMNDSLLHAFKTVNVKADVLEKTPIEGRRGKSTSCVKTEPDARPSAPVDKNAMHTLKTSNSIVIHGKQQSRF
jgi:hypothetical protein